MPHLPSHKSIREVSQYGGWCRKEQAILNKLYMGHVRIKSYLHLIHKHRWSRVADTVYLLYTVPHTLYKSTVEKGDLLLLYRHTHSPMLATRYIFL